MANSDGTTTAWLYVYSTTGVFEWRAMLDRGSIEYVRDVVLDASTVFVRPSHSGLGPVSAFNLSGHGCSGNPLTCTAVWNTSGPVITGQIEPPGGVTRIAVRDGRLFVAEKGFVAAYDAAGSSGCSGQPLVCHPTWQSIYGQVVDMAVRDGHVVTYTPGTLRSYPLAAASCAAVLACDPEWTANPPLGSTAYGLSVAGDVVYVITDRVLSGFSASGSLGCVGLPLNCSALWSHEFPGFVQSAFVVGGTLYATGWLFPDPATGLEAFSVPSG